LRRKTAREAPSKVEEILKKTGEEALREKKHKEPKINGLQVPEAGHAAA